MMPRALCFLALIVLAVGLLAGTAVPVRAMAHQHHHGVAVEAGEPCAPASADHASAGQAAPCNTHHDQNTPSHQHGMAGCVCAVGACDLTMLPARLEAVVYTRLSGLPPAADRIPPVLAPAPPHKPPRA